MRDGTLPAAMAMAMAGMMLGYRPVRIALAGLLVAALAALGVAALPLPRDYGEATIVFSCVMIAVASVPVYFPNVITGTVAIALAGVIGVAAGSALAAATTLPGSYLALLGLFTVVPSYFAVRANFAVAPRVVGSWLLAVALLAAILPFVTSHPGYVPDHRG